MEKFSNEEAINDLKWLSLGSLTAALVSFFAFWLFGTVAIVIGIRVILLADYKVNKNRKNTKLYLFIAVVGIILGAISLGLKLSSESSGSIM